MWASFFKKKNILNKKLGKSSFGKRLRLDQIQNDDQNIDGVDWVHHIQSLHGPKPLPGSTFHSVMLGSFDLHAV